MLTNDGVTRTPALQSYANGGHATVSGWLTQLGVDLTRKIEAVQSMRNLHGGLCEIGVHNGRYFILLHHLLRENEPALAIDLFHQQEQNIDHSGHGDLQLFKNCMSTTGCDSSRVTTRAANSLEVTGQQIIDTLHGRPRLFSIDGGHTAELTCNDMEIAAECIAEGGIVIVDDLFNQHFPGVGEGVYRFFARHGNRLVPVAFGGNKFFLTTSVDHARTYQQHIRSFRDCDVNTTEMNGQIVFDCAEFPPPTLRTRMKNLPAWQSFSRTGAGKLLLRAKNGPPR